MYKAFFFFSLIICAACGDMNETYKEFLKGGERIYIGKADSLKVHPGNHRLQLSWLAISDPFISHAKVFWNNRTDSLMVTINKTENIDTVNVMVQELAEGDYSFEVITFDDRGNSSVAVQAIGQVYGENYISSLLNRPITSYQVETDSITLVWGAYRPGAFATEILFKNTEGKEQTIRAPVTDNATKLGLFESENELKYRTLYLPDSLAIDTFFTDFTTLPLVRPIKD